MVFAELKEGEACDYIYAMVTSLADYTYLWRPSIKRRAIKHLEEFVGERIEIKRDLVEEMSEFTEKYKNLIT